MGMLIAIVLMLVGLALLIKGADWLIHGAGTLARLAGVPAMVVGLTVVAFGTSAPELAAGIGAALRGHPELNIGNVVGSNIANIGLILGLSAIIGTVPVAAGVVRKDVAAMIVVTAVGVTVLWEGTIDRWEGVLLSLGIVGYMLWQYRAVRNEPEAGRAVLEAELESELGPTPASGSMLRCMGLVLVGVVALTAGSWLLVEGATRAAMMLGVSEYVVGLLAVAFGTSVPELATCIRAVAKNEADLAVGNVIGSNIFNILCVLGVTSLIAPIHAPAGELVRDLAVMVAMAVACVPIMGRGGRISRVEGAVLVAGYLAYVVVVAVTGRGG